MSSRPLTLSRWALVIAGLAAVHAATAGQSAPTVDPEAATAQRLAAIRREPGPLQAFLREMPKGGDLHNHLAGGIYAESFVRWSVEDKLCLAVQTLSIVAAPCDPSTGRPLLADAVRNTDVYNQIIDSMSMRHWDPRLNGHDHFFAAFAKFGPSTARIGDMVADAASRAAAEHVSYLELTMNIDGGVASRLAPTEGWESDLARMRERLLAAGLKDQVLAAARSRLDAAEARKNDILKCGRPQADAGCAVTIRYIQQVLRASAPAQVFAQMLGAFEIATADPRAVAVNPVQPEDDALAIRDFPLQMQMFDYLHRLYPAVAISMHAGELTDGLVPPDALRFHIRQSVEVGHAQRIGHGVSVMSEDDPFGLLREMAARRVLVEIALTSNDVILGVRGPRHPLTTYLKYGVPVALATDDAGVSRSSHTLEFVKAVEDHDLDYPTLKRMVRNSIEYAFVDAATKSRLKTQLEDSLRAFERKQAASALPVQ